MRPEQKIAPASEFSSENQARIKDFIRDYQLDQPGKTVDRETFEGLCRELAVRGPLDFDTVKKRISVLVSRIGWINEDPLQTVDVGGKPTEAKPPAPVERVKLSQALSDFRFAQGIDRRGDVWSAGMLDRFEEQFSSLVDRELAKDVIKQELRGTLG